MMNSASSSAAKIRLGAISFVNTVPIYAHYNPPAEVNLVYEAPATLNAMMLTRQLDISPVSSACYLRNQDQLVLLADLSVSSPGAVESVLFLSRTPMGKEMLDNSVINIPDDSETSVMLLAYLLQEATGQDLRPWFRIYKASQFRETLQQSGNALIIGDNALVMKETLGQEQQPYYCYDLSTLWQEKTGLPFVFAVWVANRQWAKQNPTALQEVNQALCQAREHFYADPAAFQAGLDKARQCSLIPEATLRRYYTQALTYGLSPAHYESLNRFASILTHANPWESVPSERQATS